MSQSSTMEQKSKGRVSILQFIVLKLCTEEEREMAVGDYKTSFRCLMNAVTV